MPNHVHSVFALPPGEELSRLVHSWKRHAAVQINRQRGKLGATLWQKDYFDRLVRDAAHLGRCVRYIRQNPKKAGLRAGEYLLWESELAQKF